MKKLFRTLGTVRKTYLLVGQVLVRNPVILLPFAAFGLLELGALILAYVSPRTPFIALFGPPIKTFWGEQFLHYPTNFLLLNKLTSLARMVLGVLFGGVLSGIAVHLTASSYRKSSEPPARAFGAVMKKYLQLFALLLFITMLFYLAGKVLSWGLTKYFVSGHRKLLFLGPRFWLGIFLLLSDFIMSWLIQAAFIYTIPLIVIDNVKLAPSLWRSLLLALRWLWATLILVLIPLLMYVPVLLLKLNTTFLISRLYPEFVLLVSLIGLVVTNLLVDPLTTIATTVLYLEQKGRS